MGLFRARAELDEEFARVLLNQGHGTAAVVARNQSGIRAALRTGELVKAIAVDEDTAEPTVVVAGRRVLIMRKGGRVLDRSVDVTDMDAAFVERPERRLVPVSLDGVGVRIRFHDRRPADALASTINRLIMVHRPRAVPTLYPAYFVDVLSAAGVPTTPVNIAHLVERTAVMIGGQAAAYFAQGAAPESFVEFVDRFARNDRLDQRLQVVDEMIDWLWAWHPGCHRDLTRRVKQWREGSLGPNGFLRDTDEVEPWSDGHASGVIALWDTVYRKNQR